MTSLKTLTLSVSALALGTGIAAADPALIFDLGGKFDKSFNEAAYNGAERWRGRDRRRLPRQSKCNRLRSACNLRAAWPNPVANPIVVMGFQNAPTLEEVAPDYPDTSFVLIDAVADLPNVALCHLCRA